MKQIMNVDNYTEFIQYKFNKLFDAESQCSVQVTNPNKSTITYDVNDLFDYIDSLPDLCVLLQTDNGRYAPWGKKWVKTKLFDCLRQQAGR